MSTITFLRKYLCGENLRNNAKNILMSFHWIAMLILAIRRPLHVDELKFSVS